MDDERFIARIEELLVEQKKQHAEAMNQLETKSFIDPETKEKQERLEQETTKLVTQCTELKAAVNGLEEKAGRPLAKPTYRTLGRQFVESDGYKSANFTGRLRLQVTLPGVMQQKVASGLITEAAYPAAALYTYVPGVSYPQQLPMTIRSLLTVTAINTNAIEWVQDTWTLNADYQLLEGDKKALSLVDYVEKTSTVKTIAHYIKISRQAAMDIPSIMSSIDNRLRYGVLLKEDKELLYGAGTAGKLTGLMTTAMAATGALPAGGTQLDQILGAIYQLTSQGYMPTNIVLSPSDWGGIMSLKTGMGTYVYNGPPVGMPSQVIWGVPVTVSLSMAPKDFLVGAFPGNAELFDRETVTVDVAYENEDDFVKNLVTVRAEERIMVVMYVPQAFVKGVFAAGGISFFSAPVGEEEPGQLTGGNGKTLESGAHQTGVHTSEGSRTKVR